MLFYFYFSYDPFLPFYLIIITFGIFFIPFLIIYRVCRDSSNEELDYKIFDEPKE